MFFESKANRGLDRSSIRNGFVKPLPGQLIIGMPSLPRRKSPLADASNVVFGIDRLVYVDDSEDSPLPRGGVVRARQVC